MQCKTKYNIVTVFKYKISDNKLISFYSEKINN